MRHGLSTLLLTLLLAATAMANSAKETERFKLAPPDSIAEAGMDLLLLGKYEDMVDTFIPPGNHKHINDAQITQLKNQCSANLPLFKKFLRYELISRKEISKSLVMLNYLIIGEERPLQFKFLFYKPKDTWLLAHFSFTDKHDEIGQP